MGGKEAQMRTRHQTSSPLLSGVMPKCRVPQVITDERRTGEKNALKQYKVCDDWMFRRQLFNPQESMRRWHETKKQRSAHAGHKPAAPGNVGKSTDEPPPLGALGKPPPPGDTLCVITDYSDGAVRARWNKWISASSCVDLQFLLTDDFHGMVKRQMRLARRDCIQQLLAFKDELRDMEREEKRQAKLLERQRADKEALAKRALALGALAHVPTSVEAGVLTIDVTGC
jgi:hypothetical protein